MPLYIAKSGDLEGCNACLTDGQTLKDSATQLLTKYKSGALVTQYDPRQNSVHQVADDYLFSSDAFSMFRFDITSAIYLK